MKPFTIAVPEADLADLRDRLARTRWPAATGAEPWRDGADLGYLQELVAYWQRDFDWRTHEARLNALPQFLSSVGGVDLHFAHVRSANPAATPLLLVHGWPDSFDRFHRIVPLLTDAFDLVMPSIPGFGFGERRPLPPAAVADAFAELMGQLGYGRFVAHGGDIGSGVVMALAQRHPGAVRAIHLTDVGYPSGTEEGLTPAERRFVTDTLGFVRAEGAYLSLQATKPQTLAFALHDSPVALAAWQVGMIRSQSTDVEAAFGGRDALLTGISLSWLTGTAGSAAGTYRVLRAAPATPRSTVPAGIALFPLELQFPEEFARRRVAVQRFRAMPRGGHFAALEAPEVLAGELREFLAGRT